MVQERHISCHFREISNCQKLILNISIDEKVRGHVYSILLISALKVQNFHKIVIVMRIFGPKENMSFY